MIRNMSMGWSRDRTMTSAMRNLGAIKGPMRLLERLEKSSNTR
jgi:hypothetical protein